MSMAVVLLQSFSYTHASKSGRHPFKNNDNNNKKKLENQKSTQVVRTPRRYENNVYSSTTRPRTIPSKTQQDQANHTALSFENPKENGERRGGT